nr:ribonuclease H-like domain-containing protein [Tanacetum cinerariifolium]
MTNCNPSRTLVDTDSKLGPEGVPVQDPTLYRSLAGGLQYLTFTRPDIFYAVQQICLYMHDPREPHLADLKRILRYIRGTLDFGFHLYSSTTISLVGYTDADWAGCPSTRRSTSAETAWLRNLLRELHSPLSAATLVYCDNVSATYLSANPVQHQRTKHIKIDIHFVRDLVTAGQVRVFHDAEGECPHRPTKRRKFAKADEEGNRGIEEFYRREVGETENLYLHEDGET